MLDYLFFAPNQYSIKTRLIKMILRHSVNTSFQNMNEIKNWLKTNNIRGWYLSMEFVYDNPTLVLPCFSFWRSRDAIFFKLKWG